MGRPRKYPERDILIARDSGIWVAPDGMEYPFTADVTRVRASHPIVQAMPEAFEPISVHYDVEQATARAGEDERP